MSPAAQPVGGRPDGPEGGEQVVLVDERGRAIGLAPKADVHGPDTPLHLAFSCYVLDADDRLLLSRRARHKATFPGVVTNSLCGHPGPGEPLVDAVVRRGHDELGMALTDVRLVLPTFRYRAQMHGVVEHEICPVLLARPADGAQLAMDPDETEDAWWLPWSELLAGWRDGALGLSPWCAEQVPLLDALGPSPAAWPDGDPADLPPAAHLA